MADVCIQCRKPAMHFLPTSDGLLAFCFVHFRELEGKLQEAERERWSRGASIGTFVPKLVDGQLEEMGYFPPPPRPSWTLTREDLERADVRAALLFLGLKPNPGGVIYPPGMVGCPGCGVSILRETARCDACRERRE